ncbi:hypothetical protein WH47_04096, partial [Habropoda laboriosa]
LPKYLRKSRRNGEQKTMARARCGSTENANKFWAKEEEKKCPLCEEKEGTFEHWRQCRKIGEIDLSMERILAKEGEAEAMAWLRKIEKEKEKRRNG